MGQAFRTRWAVLALALALPATACDDVTGDSGNGRVSVLLTDAPGDVKSAVVTITSIYLQGESDDGERVYLLGDASSSANVQADLVELQNEVMELTRDKVVPAGTYGQLRVVLSGACIVVEGDGGADQVYATSGYTACGSANGSLQTTSITQTGIKVNLPSGFRVESEGEQIVLLDFDVSQSFGRQAGQSGQWVMSPVIHATEAELSATANVNVTLGTDVTLPSGVSFTAFTVVLADAEGGTESLALDANGAAVFRFLRPGSYTVTLEAPAGVTITATPGTSQSLSVASGAAATTSFTITSVSTS